MVIKLTDRSEIKQLLRESNLDLKRSLGQNLLVEADILERILAVAGLKQTDTVIEVGAGLGALTQSLAEVARRVKALELDERLIPILENLFATEDRVEIIHGDARQVDFDRLGGKEYRVVANLPYSTANPIIRRLLEEDFNVKELVVMVQQEVAARMAADPGGKDYGILSIGIQYYAQPQIEFTVPPSAFITRPKVDSAVIRLTKRSTPPVEVADEEFFFQVVRAAFQQRRKMIRNALRKAANLDLERELVDQALEAAGIDARRRGEKLSIKQFARLSQQLLVLQQS